MSVVHNINHHSTCMTLILFVYDISVFEASTGKILSHIILFVQE